MKLKVLVPDRILVDRQVSRIAAWDRDGSFCMLPRHIDYVSALAPGLLSFEIDDEFVEFIAIDEGVLVKRGPEVLVATRRAVSKSELEELERSLKTKIEALDVEERESREAVARLEADSVRWHREGTDEND